MTQFARKLKLSNGLTVVYEKNNASDVVSLNIGVRLGSVNESDAESGLCHLIEHMVFKGTKTHEPGEIAVLVEASGGELNAYTSLDQTVYYINTPARHFEQAAHILKEMVFDARFDPAELEREKEVVVEEIRRGMDNPMRVLGELLFASVFLKHNYRRPVIGTEKLVRGFSRDQVYSFYKKHYQPQNMIFGVCGNVNESELSHVLEKLFRFEASSPLQFEPVLPEPEKKQASLKMQPMDIQATYFDIGFAAPDLAHPDVPALDILSHLLGESSTSLLEKFTREKEQLVHSIYSNCYTPKHPGVFVIGGQVDPDKINAALSSIRRQIITARTELFDEDALSRAKMLMKSQLIFDKETCEGTARKWMLYETIISDFSYDKKYIEKIESLTTEDVRRVAGEYLDPARCTLAILHPKRAKIRVDRSFFAKISSVVKKRSKPLVSHRGIYLHELSNGVRVLVHENHRLPIASLKLTSLGGLRYETHASNGLSHLMSHCLTKGTQSYTYMQLAERCETLAVSMSGYAGRNSWGGSCAFLSERMRPAVLLFADMILHPAFDKSEVEKEISLQLEAIKNQGDNPGHMAFRMAMQTLFNKHPYSLDMLGKAERVRRYTPDFLKKDHGRLCVSDNLVMSVVGDVRTGEILDVLEREFSELKHRPFVNKKIKKPKGLSRQKHVFHELKRNQAHVVIGFLALSLYDEDRYVLDVINSILSGQGGRLFLELRDKNSLAYTVSANFVEGLETGFFSTYIGTEPGKVSLAIAGMFTELEKIKTEKIGSEELKRAKNYIIGNHEIDHQKNGAIALQIALNELYGVDLTEFHNFSRRIQRVTADDVRRVAQKYIDFDRCVVSVVGPKQCKGIRA